MKKITSSFRKYFPSGMHIVLRKHEGMSSVHLSGLRLKVLGAFLLLFLAVVLASFIYGFFGHVSKVSANNDMQDLAAIITKLEDDLKKYDFANNTNLAIKLKEASILIKTEDDKQVSALINARSDLVADVQKKQSQLQELAKENERLQQNKELLASRVSGLLNSKEALTLEKGHLQNYISALESNLEFEKGRVSSLSSAIDTVVTRVAGVVGNEEVSGSDAVRTSDFLAKKLEKLFSSQSEIFDKITNDSANYLYDARKIISDLGLDPNEVVPLPEDAGLGGPIVEENPSANIKDKGVNLNDVYEKEEAGSIYGTEEYGSTDAMGGRLEILPIDANYSEEAGVSSLLTLGDKFARKLDDLEKFYTTSANAHNVVACLPLGYPLKSFSRTSGYGYRRDPFTGNKAFHAGLDLRGSYKSSIYSQSSGKIIRAGYSGAYGNAVIIDHGCNIRTLYAHLSAVNVRVGQEVKKGDVIGALGSTGRSTGPHLHYEVIFKGKRFNPAPFVNVYKNLDAGLAESLDVAFD